MRIRTALCTAALALLARVAGAQGISYDYDRHADFAAYHTYVWVGDTLADDLNHARIVAAVDSQLAGKGLARVEGVTPDLQVFYQVGLRRDLEFNGYDSRLALPEGGPLRGRLEPVPVGTLVVGIVTGGRHALVWRAAATKDLDPGQRPEQWERNINRAVEKMFKHYPAAGQGVR